MKQKSTKRALLASVLSIVICLTMLIGSTFAWFTDTASTGVNVIKSGNLEIGFEYADGTEAVDTANWLNAEGASIFDYEKWEPGYTVAKHIRITNKGNLAFKYQVSFKLDGAVGKLAEVIDVYFVDPAATVATRDDVAALTSIGTLDKFLSGNAIFGDLKAGDSNLVTVVLKMQESANNDYQNETVGDGLTIRLDATQDTVENDSFNDQYDKGAMLPDEKLVVNSDDTLSEAIESKTDYTVEAGQYSKVIVADGVNVTVNGGTFPRQQVIAARNGGTVTVNNATVGDASAGGGPNIVANVNGSSTVIINGGSYLANTVFYGDGTGSAVINGGFFDCGSLYINYYGKPIANLTITGGTFSSMLVMGQGMMGPSISDFVPDTHQIINNADGSCTVVAK